MHAPHYNSFLLSLSLLSLSYFNQSSPFSLSFSSPFLYCYLSVFLSFFLSLAVSLSQPPALAQLVALYVGRSHALWKEAPVLLWLEGNVSEVLRRVDAQDPQVEDCLNKCVTFNVLTHTHTHTHKLTNI